MSIIFNNAWAKPNYVVHFDFLYMVKGGNEKQYVLLLNYDLSSFSWLIPCRSASSVEAAKAISRCIRVFTIMKIWVSRQGFHFKNYVMEYLASSYNCLHQFVVAYTA